MLTHSYIKHPYIDRDFPRITNILKENHVMRDLLHKAKILRENNIIDNSYFSMNKKKKTKQSNISSSNKKR